MTIVEQNTQKDNLEYFLKTHSGNIKIRGLINRAGLHYPSEGNYYITRNKLQQHAVNPIIDVLNNLNKQIQSVKGGFTSLYDFFIKNKDLLKFNNIAKKANLTNSAYYDFHKKKEFRPLYRTCLLEVLETISSDIKKYANV